MYSSELTRWRDRYTAAGLLAIPLRAGDKRPCGPWKRPPGDQWAQVGAGFSGNVGVVLGGPESVCVVDCDDSAAIGAVLGHFEALGAALPTVSTPSGGLHVYFKASGAPEGFTWGLLAPSVGKGELRARDCYVVAPASDYGGRWYHFVAGGPEAIARQRPIAWGDVAPLALGKRQPTRADPLDELPVRLVWRELPARTRGLLTALGTASKGRPVGGGRYATRSEAEAAVCATAALCGWGFPEVLRVFELMRPGHFAECARPDAYLERTWRKALGVLAASGTREVLALRHAEASSWPWPGRSGGSDRAVYLALLAVCWQCDSLVVEASVRSLGEHSGLGRTAVASALRRLVAGGFVALERPSHYSDGVSHATTWRVIMANKRTKVTGGRGLDGFLPGDLAQANVARVPPEVALGELWARPSGGGLGKSAALVRAALGGVALRVSDLAAATGKHRQTVRTALLRLEAVALAERVGRAWRRGPASLSEVAAALDCGGAARLRRTVHVLEREALVGRRERDVGA